MGCYANHYSEFFFDFPDKVLSSAHFSYLPKGHLFCKMEYISNQAI